MATRKATKKATTTARKGTAKAPARAARRPAAKKAAAPRRRQVRPGLVAHTELASSDPAATKAWAQKVLGWKFGPSMPMPDGSEYHMWQFGDNTGGGIRANAPPEAPGTIPYCETADIQAAYAKALKAGAREMLPPQQLPEGMGWIAVVQAPGGVPIGLWALA